MSKTKLFIISFGIIFAFGLALAGENSGFNDRRTGVPALITSTIDRTITYQGILKNNLGNPVPNSSYNLTFRIYKLPAGGSALWTSASTPVTTTGGLFSTQLGPISLPFDTTYYVSVQVQGDVEMSRQVMTMSPYSAVSDTANYAKAAVGDVKWIFRITDTADTTLISGGKWGLARNGNVLWGNADSTHVNLGVQCTTGTSGQNYKNCTVGGGIYNVANGDRTTIGGGQNNKASGIVSTVCGGDHNMASGNYATIGGGQNDTASNYNTTVSGGQNNVASSAYAAVGGGYSNIADGYSAAVVGGYSNVANGYSAVVVGGYHNTASGADAMVGGGYANTASGFGAAVVGGEADTARAVHGGVVSGYHNTAGATSTDSSAFVGGGANNNASGKYSTIAGGLNNLASSLNTTIGGGGRDTASNQWATISGGSHNVASGWGSMIPGGAENVAAGTYSFAGGLGAHANHSGCFIWGDDVGASYLSDRDGQTKFRSYGGVKFDINNSSRWIEFYDTGGRLINTSAGAYLSTAGVWTNNSDRNLKENLTPIDGSELLSKISQLSVTRWNYKSDNKSVTHIGPMAQDFKRLFEVGNDSTTISSIDPAGVALAGVQEIIKENKELRQIITELERRISELEKR